MSKLHIFVIDGKVLWRPFIKVNGETDTEGQYCKDCRELLEVISQDIKYGIYVVNGAQCPRFNKTFDRGEALDHNTFAQMRENFFHRSATKDLGLKDFIIFSFDELISNAETKHLGKNI